MHITKTKFKHKKGITVAKEDSDAVPNESGKEEKAERPSKKEQAEKESGEEGESGTGEELPVEKKARLLDQRKNAIAIEGESE
ncbi:hypothetical protein KIN20_020918 [Parelaphostrongylus tenuis]|uniref:Uncharacterized protein n=1 Tax=Parelaphostrongylus tenuis TaxID=148309 RepID=A0AAD5MTG2_PARTN|nr:hypothetical protein KIN20_020918 [Parelaphostrongylus tenuis]